MGLIKAAAGAIGGTLADQWKDYFGSLTFLGVFEKSPLTKSGES